MDRCFKIADGMTDRRSSAFQTWVDGYSECLHCALAHPSLNKDYAIQKYRVDPVPGARYCRHSCPRRDETDTDTCDKELSGWGNAKGLWLFAYPGLALNCFSLGFYTIKVVPLDCQTTLLEREIFVRRTPNATAAVPTQPEVDTFMDFMKQVGEEDYELCELTQKNLEKGIYSRGMLHPVQEIGVWWYQQLVLSEVQDWARKRGIGDN